MDNILIGILSGIFSGIISGCYTGLIFSRFSVFHSLKREALRIIRRFDYIDNKILGDITQNQRDSFELTLISSDFIFINQKIASLKIAHINKELSNLVVLNSNNINVGDFFESAQKEIRQMKIKWLHLLNPFNLKS